jgi:hypothetical protein
MKKISINNVFVSVVTVYLLSLFFQGCQKEIQINDPPAMSELSQSTITQSTIKYTDINPDVTKTSGRLASHQYYYLDFNNDGAIDFQIEAYFGGYKYTVAYGVRIYSMSANGVACNGSSLPLAMNIGDKINSSLNWVNTNQYSGDGLLRAYSSNPVQWRGNWTTSTDHYVGLKILQGSDSYYGWARLGVTNTPVSFTIKDYAYNSSPNQQILAGQTK